MPAGDGVGPFCGQGVTMKDNQMNETYERGRQEAGRAAQDRARRVRRASLGPKGLKGLGEAARASLRAGRLLDILYGKE